LIAASLTYYLIKRAKANKWTLIKIN
jgi:hypothetical protein